MLKVEGKTKINRSLREKHIFAVYSYKHFWGAHRHLQGTVSFRSIKHTSKQKTSKLNLVHTHCIEVSLAKSLILILSILFLILILPNMLHLLYLLTVAFLTSLSQMSYPDLLDLTPQPLLILL